MADIIISESSDLYNDLVELAEIFETSESVLRRVIDAYKKNPIPIQDKSTDKKDIAPKKKITLDVVKEIYPKAKDVYEGRIELNDALDYLEKKLHRGSALMYINVFKAMRQGESYTRTMNTAATGYFLDQIRKDYPEEGLELALKALNANIIYFERFIGEGKMKTVREIRDKFTGMLEI